METTTDEEAVAGLRQRRAPFIGIAALLLMLGILAALIWPVMSPPSLSRTIPEALTGRESVEQYLPPDDPEERLAAWVESFQAQRTAPPGLPPGVRTVAQQTAALMYTSANGFQASGFVYRSGIVISAAHLLDVGMSGARIYVDCGNGPQESEVIACDRLRDVLVVAAAHCTGKPLRLNTRRLRGNDVLYKSGFTFHAPKQGVTADLYVSPVNPLPFADKSPAECKDCTSTFRESVRRARVPRLRAISGAAIKGHSGSPVTFRNGEIAGMLVQLDGDHPRAYMVAASAMERTLSHLGIH